MKTKIRHWVLLLSAMFLVTCTVNEIYVNQNSDLEKDYFTIENAIFRDAEFPMATIEDSIGEIEMSAYVMNGAMNYITVRTNNIVHKFFIAIKNIAGYMEYVPTLDGESSGGLNTYTIPVMMSQMYRGHSTIRLSAQLDNGGITIPVENDIFYIETMPGELEIKLSFSNSKDVDLHLYTPSGEHIYYGNMGGSAESADGDSISYGLDIDSNAGCSLDHINKENIYLPAEKIEYGTYKVVVDMFSNCEPSVPTRWNVVAKYKGEDIEVSSGTNPVSGIYPAGAPNGDMTQVMTFEIEEDGDASFIRSRSSIEFKPFELSETAEMKLEEWIFFRDNN